MNLELPANWIDQMITYEISTRPFNKHTFDLPIDSWGTIKEIDHNNNLIRKYDGWYSHDVLLEMVILNQYKDKNCY